MTLTLMLVVASSFLLLTAFGACAVMLKGCFVLRRLPRVTPGRHDAVLMRSPLSPSISVVVTPRGSFAEAREQVRRLMELQYPRLELIVVMEGLSEAQRDSFVQEFRLVRATAGGVTPARFESTGDVRLVLVEKAAEANPAGAWNAGLQVATSPLLALLDDQIEFPRTLLLRLATDFLAGPADTAALCAITLPEEDPTGLPACFAALEWLRLWLARGAAFAGWNRLIPVPAAALLVRRDVVVKSGGFRGGPLELFLDLHRLRRRIRFAPDGGTYARLPESWAALSQTAGRDQSLAAGVLLRGGVKGIFSTGWAVPALLIDRWVRPVIETFVYLGALFGWIVGWVDGATVGLALLSTIGAGILTSMAAVVLRELSSLEASRPGLLVLQFFAAIAENLGYRQLRNLWLAGHFLSSAGEQLRSR